ncbi:MAG: hypothetical protein GTN75_02525 [Gemmatimonadetes bacterium]|nr:hypothetical protein [Gemmatimonadota bacterium]
MRKVAICTALVSLVVTGIIACSRDFVMDPQPMSLEVKKLDTQPLRVSFTARVVNWDGETPIEYSASACSPAGDIFICMGGPFLESSAVAERVTQPITWTEEQCGMLLVFGASLTNGEQAEVTHIACS